MQKALSAGGGEAAQLRTRIPRHVDARLRAEASRRGCSIAIIVREAIERHLAELEGPAEPFDLMQAVRSAYAP